MPGKITQFLDFSNNTNSDTGDNTAGSILPMLNGETVDQTVLNRPGESLRQRTEAVRNIERDALFLRDSDRNLIITGPGKITWPGSTTAAASGIPSISDTLWILPMLTPGFAQTAPVPPVASTFGVIHLKRADALNSIAVNSLRRSYAEGDRINITVVADLVFSCSLTVEQPYSRSIHIVATPTTTLATTIAALNGLLPPAPDNTQLVLAALEGGALGSDLLLTSQAQKYMAGNYDGEGHTLTPANMAAFFVANPASALGEGDTLCVEFVMVEDTASAGGRRQATPENGNTTVPIGSYFNSRTSPDKLVNALPICKVVNGSLVFSTGVEIPAGETNVPLSAINTLSPIIRNGGFEHGVTGGLSRFSITDWENRSDLAANGNWQLGTTILTSPPKSLEFNKTAVGASTARVEQQQELPVTPGQSVKVTLSVRQLIAPIAGVYAVNLYWGTADSAASSSSTVPFQTLAAVDGAFRSVTQMVAVPAGKRILKTVTVEVTGVTSASTGTALVVEDLQVFIENPTATTLPAVENTRLHAQTMDAVVIEDPNTYQLGQLAALARFDKATPAGEGQVILERKDQTYPGLPPALAQFGRLFQLGAKLLDSEAHALLPRVSADYSVTAGVDFTLMWESGQQGLTTGSYTQPCTRVYTSNDGQWVLTSNAVWGGTTWTKDVTGQNATKHGIGKDGLRTYTRSSDVAWSDAAWADTFRLTNPLETAADARVPRISASLFNSAANTEFTQIAAFSFTGYAARVYASSVAPDATFMVTFNAQWNGSNWVKDAAGKVATRINVGQDITTIAYPGAMTVSYQVCQSTDTFPESDWDASPTTSTLTTSGASLRAGKVFAGPMEVGFNSQGKLTAASEGYGDGSNPATFFMDLGYLIETSNFHVDTFGNPDSHNGMIFEEFWTGGLPAGWSAFTSGVGVVDGNFNGLTRLRLNPGPTDSAGIRTNPTIHAPAYASFHAELLFPNVLGKTSFGYVDVTANMYVGFIQDSGTYGDENFRVALRTGGGLQIFDTGVSLSPSVNNFIKFRAYARGGSGLVTTTSLFWSIQAKKGSASGVFTPGGSVLNPTTPLYFRFDAQNGAYMVIERMAMGGRNNFSL